jgi:RNA recognition motif-containing protein
MSVRLFVGNLPYSATEDEVRNHFAAVGPVVSVKIPVDRETGRPRGFAFVEYAERSLAEEAIRRLHNQPMGGRNLAVNEAKPPERQGGGPPRRDFPPGSGFAPRPGGRPEGADPLGGPRPGGPPGGPRPGGPPPRPSFRGDAGPSFDADPFADRGAGRGFGFDAPPRRSKKAGGGGRGGKKWTDRDRAPKGPLPERGGGRFYSVDDAEDEVEGLEGFEDEFVDEDEADAEEDK